MTRLRRVELLLAIAASVALPHAALAQEPPVGDPPAAPISDPLAQTIEAGQEIATGPAELSVGHVDLGPRLDGDAWSLMVHDDGVIPSVWRTTDDAVIRVLDTAIETVPDDPTYAFLGVEPGRDVHVVPQVQDPDVVWLGWNTQEPNAMATIDRGVTLTLLGIQGPGDLTVYLQAGNLTEPDVLWQSTSAEAQPLWVEVNTHTHANWVFTEPGVYLVRVEASADLIDGRTVATESTLRFAVGDSASADEARQTAFTAPIASSEPVDGRSDGTTAAERADGAGEADADSGGGVIVIVAVGATLLLGAALVAVIVRGSRAKRRAEAERLAARTEQRGGPT